MTAKEPTPRLFSIEGLTTKDTCHVLPTLSVSANRCEHEECKAVHGFTVHLQWLWWGALIYMGPHMIQPD